MANHIRPTWDQYFLDMLSSVRARASCDRGRSAAILTKRNRIISTGYVGSPAGLPSCDEIGHDLIEVNDGNMVSQHCVRTFHAEMNAILGCAREGVSTDGSTLYCHMVPCRNCGMAVIQAGIVRVVALNPYQKDHETRKMFDIAGIELVVVNSGTFIIYPK